MLERLIGSAPRGAEESGVPQELPLRQLKGGAWQPRQTFDEGGLRELAASIRQHGLLQPVVVRPSTTDDGRYELVVGERRWRACRMIGMEKIPVKICFVGDQEAALIALVENLQREDLQVMETAQSLQRLSIDFGLSHEEVADLLGKSRSTISNILRLLKLPEELRTLLSVGQLDMGHARALLGIEDTGLQSELAQRVVRDSLTVRETEALARRVRGGEPPDAPLPTAPAATVAATPVEEGAADGGAASAVVADPGAPALALPLEEGAADGGAASAIAVDPEAPALAPPPAAASGAGHRLDADARRLEERLAEHLGATAQLRPATAGGAGGHLEVRYHDTEHLQEVLRRMGLAAVEQDDDSAAGSAADWA